MMRLSIGICQSLMIDKIDHLGCSVTLSNSIIDRKHPGVYYTLQGHISLEFQMNRICSFSAECILYRVKDYLCLANKIYPTPMKRGKA